jgi:outer membrane cobalamin receptor
MQNPQGENMFKKFMAGLCLLAAPVAVLAAQEPAAEKPAYTFKGGEIVITDSARPNIESAGLTTTVNEDEMKSRSDKTLADVLFNLPGFTTYQSAKGTTVFDLRGFGHDKLALLVDGLPFEEVYYGGGGDISRISVLNASKVVVNRGVSSALYGTAGMFGTINVVTKKPEELFAEVAAEYGEHGNYTLTAAHGAPIGDFYYWITASMQNSNGYETSKKLDAETKREWLDKFVQYDIYGKTYNDLDLDSVRKYLTTTMCGNTQNIAVIMCQQKPAITSPKIWKSAFQRNIISTVRSSIPFNRIPLPTIETAPANTALPKIPPIPLTAKARPL